MRGKGAIFVARTPNAMLTEKPYLIVVDDDPDDLLIFQQEFEVQHPGISVFYLSSGMELLDNLAHSTGSELPPVILLDFKMPDVSGAEILELLNADRKYDRLVRIVWSTSQLAKDIESCRRLGVADFLVKPASNEELHCVVSKVVRIFETATGVVH
jgi:CheY-like chemotaxis protein